MKRFKKLAILIVFTIFTKGINAQPWIEGIKSENPTFQEIQKSFYDYWDGKPIEKGKGYKLFKRWEWFWETRVLADGHFPKSTIIWDEYNSYLKSHAEEDRDITAANWSFMGPSTTPGGYTGMGRVNCMAFHPTDVNTFWVGTPAGGLWKTINGGNTWTTNTDNLPVLGVSDIAIDPTNPSIMYIATGDGDLGSLYSLTANFNGDTKSVGVLKSTDGGNTWNTTGLNWSVTSTKLIRRLIINPNNPQILLAAASDGIWRTTDGGTTWTNVQTGYFTDLEFQPSNPTVIYASTMSWTGNARIFRSTNSGINWFVVETISNGRRINLAVSPNNPLLVDALCANLEGGLAGLWNSNDGGSTFAQYFFSTNSNNLLHTSYNASGAGGQGYYDLAYSINPANVNDIWLGGINTWNSTDGGNNWNLKTMWNQSANINPTAVPVVHADKHFFAFHPLQAGTFFDCNDGGIYKTTNAGATWTDLSNGLQISQMYRIGVSQTATNNVFCGLQDNGSRQLFGSQWYSVTGGDGMESIIDYTNNNNQYTSYSNGVLYRTLDLWTTLTTISDNFPGGQPEGAWVTPFVMDPVNPSILYAGYDKVYKTTNQGNSWTAISPVLATDLLRSIAVAPSNANVIYAASYDTLYKTTNGGSTWTLMPLPLALGSLGLAVTYIAVNPTNPQQLFFTVSGYSSVNKVYKSDNGGQTWINYAGTLPNVSVNCITYQNGINEGLYLGTDVGVFYRDLNLNDWVTYQTGLPNVVVTELEITYNDNKLWAATYGRGLWNSNLYSTPTGLDAQNLLNDISVFPNPNDGQFTIQVPKSKVYDIAVYNMLGEKILDERELKTSQKTIEINDAKPGVYLLNISIDNQVISRKINISK
jgi:photosystem II stability/assembly factor-like uncharacterized protein